MDDSSSRSAQSGQALLRDKKWSPDIRGEDAVPFFHGDPFEGAGLKHSRVVDKNVDCSKALEHGIDRLRHAFWIPYITFDGHAFAIRRSEFLNRSF